MSGILLEPPPQVVFRLTRDGCVIDYEAALAGPLRSFVSLRRGRAVHRSLHANCASEQCELRAMIAAALTRVESARILEWEQEDQSGSRTLRLHLRRGFGSARSWATLTVTDISEARRLAGRLAATNMAFAKIGGTIRRQSARTVQRLDRRLSNLSSELIVAQYDERRRIAQDLHDGIGQWLSMAKLSLETGMQRIGMHPAREDLQRAFRQIETAINEVRNISADLTPTMLQQIGLVATLELLCHEMRISQPKAKIECSIDGIGADVPAERGAAMVRILQEALTNIARHSRATRVWVEAHLSRYAASLRVMDNGVGSKAEGDREVFYHGVGMHNMRERATRSGGVLRVKFGDAGGTEVLAVWPAAKAATVRALRDRSRSRRR